MERLRTVKVTVEIDTNKRTETAMFNLDDYDTADEDMAAAESYLIDMIAGID